MTSTLPPTGSQATGYQVLLVEEDPIDVEQFASKAARAPVAIRFVHARHLEEARALPELADVDAIILGLNQPGSKSLDLISAVVDLSPFTPVVVLAETFDDDTAVRALACGAEEYLLKEKCDGHTIARAIRYAVGRMESQHEVQQLNEELRHAQEHLIQSARLEAVGQLAAGIAHEIKNPLGILVYSLKYLRDAPPDDPKLNLVYQRMENAVKRADLLLSEMLDFAKPRAAHFETGPVEVPIRRAIDLTLHRLKEKSAELGWEVAPDVPPFAFDAGKITQALINLISNAFDAAPQRGGRIKVSATYRPPRRRRGASGPASVVIEVSDNGGGVPERMLDRIFDPFFTTKDLGVGYGLGLCIVQRIAQMHGGTVRVENRPPGAVSVLEIPVSKRAQTQTRKQIA